MLSTSWHSKNDNAHMLTCFFFMYVFIFAILTISATCVSMLTFADFCSELSPTVTERNILDFTCIWWDEGVGYTADEENDYNYNGLNIRPSIWQILSVYSCLVNKSGKHGLTQVNCIIKQCQHTCNNMIRYWKPHSNTDDEADMKQCHSANMYPVVCLH